MKPVEQTIVQSFSSVNETMRMQIDTHSLEHLMGILTNLYSDPILAVIREYSTNALDSHIEAGLTDPIEIILPTREAPVFQVRDHGVGLNVSDLRDVYSMYGKSTKRGTDEQTGMLGLGCKSGLTYALAFTVEAIKDGVKTVATVTKDHDGVGTIKILDTSGTTEHNGVLVSIPVKPFDVSTFCTKATELFRYWRGGMVLVDGEEPESLAGTPLWLDDDIAIYNSYGDSHVVMGGVAYPFHTEERVSVVSWVPMGSVHFTPSREALHMTSHTKATLQTIKDFVATTLPGALERHMEDAKTPFEKFQYALEWRTTKAAQAWIRDVISDMLTPVERPWFDRGYRCSKQEDRRLNIDKLNNADKIWVVHEFPFKGVSPSHKERLDELEINAAVIIPNGTDLSHLRGRTNMITWEKVIEKTKAPSKQVRARTKTRYSYSQGGRRYDNETIDGNDPIVYYGMKEHVPTISQFPTVRFVQLYSNQIPRFERLHPTAMRYGPFVAKERDKALKALTETDRIFHSVVSAHQFSYKVQALTPRVDQLLDPDLQKLINAIKAQESPALAKYKALGAGYQAIPGHDLREDLCKRYPLFGAVNIDRVNIEDMILYLNTKHLLLAELAATASSSKITPTEGDSSEL